MTAFNPIAQFQLNKQEREDFANISALPLLHRAFTFTLAELAFEGATEEQLKGARRAIETFLNLSEPPNLAPLMRSKPLQTYDPRSSRPTDGTAVPGT